MRVVVPLKRGYIYVIIRLPVTAGPIIMAHLIGHTSRQSSRTRPNGSPFQTAELCSSDTCRRHRRYNAEFRLPTWWRVWFPRGVKRRFLVTASTVALTTGALILTSCSTPQTRISEHPDLYHSLSHRDQALVGQGQVRIGMSRTAVWLAWGSPDRKVVANIGGGPRETWAYIYYVTYPYYPGYGPWGPYLGAPLYDPFYYSDIPPTIHYPGKIVTFANGRVVAFRYVASH